MPCRCCHSLNTQECSAAKAPKAPKAEIAAFQNRFMGMVNNAAVLAVAAVADRTGLFQILANSEKALTVEEVPFSFVWLHPNYL